MSLQLTLGGTGQHQTPRAIEMTKLKPAAHEFEASLMKEFLEPLEHDSLFDDRGDESDESGDSVGGSNGTLMSFGSQAMAKAISERGGFGIATKILDHFQSLGTDAGGKPIERPKT